ncbi:Uncharacterised protein [Mycobacteroides abscessus subsp. abscessus]|nr:Uncharacterised protein [Mycobacteroides abscessus subsp. abscessus]
MKCASRSRHHATISSALGACVAGSATTTATTRSPHFASLPPITAASNTAGWRKRTCSTSIG